jgi:hydrogenase nickel incorporation protein HypA/HybF
MHEYAIAQAIADVAEDERRRAGASRVVSLTVELGELSGVIEDYLVAVFPLVVHGTPLEGAELLIERVAGQAWCARCQDLFNLAELLTPCPRCDGFASEIRAGDALTLASLEVE